MTPKKKQKTRLVAACIAIAAASASTAASNDAAACTQGPDPDGHYYAEIDSFYDTRSAGGASVLINTNSLVAANASSFVDHEMWYGVVGDGSYWVEVGVTTGAEDGGGFATDAVFWADNRNGGGYHEHYPNVSWSFNAWYQAKVVWAGTSCAWNVFFGGVDLGTSTSNCGGSSRALEAGLESTNDSASQHVGGSLNGWAALTGSTWVSGWDGPSLYANCPADIELENGNTTGEQLHGPL